MENAVFRVTEVVGTSSEGIEPAIKHAVGRASQTLRNLDWFQVEEVRGYIAAPDQIQYQVTLKVGFRLDE